MRDEELINMATYLQRNGGVPLDHPRRCTAHKQNGQPCRRYAARGGNVCRVHGGAAPQVVAKARERLALAADRMARELLGIATGAESEAVKLAAVKDALDRAGLAAKTAVEVEVKAPWEDVFADVAQISRAESRARRGITDDTPALAEAVLEVVDAELVPEDGTDSPADVDPRHRTPTDRVTGAAPRFAAPSGPSSSELMTMEDAVAEAADANRRARTVRVRRVR
jgi:hypothetical protein